MHVVDVVHDPTAPGGGRLVLTVESDADVAGCPVCGVIAGLHARREHTAADAPCFGIPTRVVWRKRVWRCREAACPGGVFSETHSLIGPRVRVRPHV